MNAHSLLLRPTPTKRPRSASAQSAEPVGCPHCGHTAGFILDEDGFGYRVLEDHRDTDLLADHDASTPLACAHCDTTITLVDALGLAELAHGARQARKEAQEMDDDETDRPPGTGFWRIPQALRSHRRHHHRAHDHDAHHTMRGHPHDAGGARERISSDGRILPACPQCPRDHGFFADLGGVAYHVLEDDADTDLLDEANNLLCPDCGAVFTTRT